MRIPGISVLSLCILQALVVSCHKNPYKVNVKSIEVDVKIQRLEKDLFTMNPEDIGKNIPMLKEKYGGFLQLFSAVINAGSVQDSTFGEQLLDFCTDKQNNEVYALTMEKYQDINDIKAGLEQAFRHYRHYFPEKQIPGVFTCITGFNASILTISGDTLLGIGLDRYLGADCEYYSRLGIYPYISARMTRENIVPDCIYGWAASQWDFSLLKYPADNVLARIIHEGKLRYFERCMLPDAPDELIFGFTPEQMTFCRSNEALMWMYLVEKDLLFKTDQLTIRKLTDEAPFTSFFTRSSPGRAAVWLGFRIAESYMAKNPGTTLDRLMKDTDIQGILDKARYNPK